MLSLHNSLLYAKYTQWRGIMGMAVVRVRCRGQVEEEFGLVMVGGKGPSLFGRD